MKSPESYSVGMIVMYSAPSDSLEGHNSAIVVPAIIVRTWEKSGYQNDEVNLSVFCDGPDTTWRTSVHYSKGKEPGTWHWPEIK